MEVNSRGNPFNPKRIEVKLIDAVEGTKDGETLDVSSIKDGNQAVAVTGIGTATIQIEGTLDNINYFQIGSDITGNGITQIAGHYLGIRAKISVHSSGIITVKYSGRM